MPSYESNVYYHPEAHGLETVGEHDCAGSYEFDTLVVFRRLSDGVLLWAQDSGCSCPTPFENTEASDLRVVDFEDPDWKQAVEHQTSRYGYDNNATSVAEFLRKIKSAEAQR